VNVPLPLGSRTVTVLQLPASYSNSSQGLNRSSPQTHSLTNQLTPLHWLAAISHLYPTFLTVVSTLSQSESESGLFYKWRFTATSPLRLTTINFIFQLNIYGYSPYVTSSLSFTIAVGSHQGNHSQVRVPRDSSPYFTLSDSRLHQPGGPDPRVYILQKHCRPVIPLSTGLLFRRLLRLTGLRLRYSTAPPHAPVLSSLSLSLSRVLCYDRRSIGQSVLE
jgi:hypothetical protein